MVTTFFSKAYYLFPKSILPFWRGQILLFLIGIKRHLNAVKTPLKHCFNSTPFLENECSGKIYRSINI